MRWTLAVLNVLLALSLLLWPLAAISTAFMFDAPGSESSRITIALAISIVSYPLPVVVGNIGFWVCFRRHKPRAALWFTLLGFTGWWAIFGLFLALLAICDGQFACR